MVGWIDGERWSFRVENVGQASGGAGCNSDARDWVCALDGVYPPFALTTELLVSKHC